MKLSWSERSLLLVLFLVIATPVALLLARKSSNDPVEEAVLTFAGNNAVNCGLIEENDEPNTKKISGCAADARKRGRNFYVRRNLVLPVGSTPRRDNRWSTAIVGFPDGNSRSIYIRHEPWGGVIVSNGYGPDRKFQWTLDMDDVRGNQLKTRYE